MTSTYSFFISLFVALCYPLLSLGDQLYISPDGSDSNDGSRMAPLKTIAHAQERARALRTNGTLRGAVEIILLPGQYVLTKPLHFGPEDSGTDENPLIVRGEGKVFLSGGMELGLFEEVTPALWKIDLEDNARYGFQPDQLFVNGIRAVCARTPNLDEFFPTKSVSEFLIDTASAVPPGFAAQKIHLDRLQMTVFDRFPWTPSGMWVEVYHNWTTTKKPVQWVSKPDSALYILSKPSRPWNKLGDNSQFFLVNHRSFLDAPGEWFYSRDDQAIYYVPRPEDKIESSAATSPMLDHLLVIQGSPDTPVVHLTFENIAFHYTRYKLPEAGKDGQQAEAAAEAAIMVDYAQQVHFHKCEIAHTGTYGLWYREACKDSQVEQSYLHDLGAGGIKIGTLGIPADEQLLTRKIRVDNNIIRSGGHELPAGVGIIIFQASDNTVSHNEIADFRYSGISVGWVWGYTHSPTKRNEIVYNHIHHLGWGQLSDMGGVYLLGASEGTLVSNNVIHHIHAYGYGGWGIYTDEGSTGIRIENNLVYRCKTGGFHQHYGRDNQIVNNVFANQLKAQLEATRVEDHTSFSFKRNVIFFEQGELYGINWDKVRFEADSNIYWTPHDTPLFGKMTFGTWKGITGKDKHSILQDPRFKNPDADDYRFTHKAVLSKIDFQPFNYRKAGVYGNRKWVELARLESTRTEKFDKTVAMQMGWTYGDLKDRETGKPSLSIGLVADAQYCDCETANNRYYRRSLFKLRDAVHEFNRKEVDFVINLGDLIDRDYESYRPVLAELSSLDKPIYHVLGNHDFAVAPDFLNRLPRTLGMESRYYTIKKGNYRFIILDGNDVSTFGNAADTRAYDRAREQLANLKSKNAANAKDWNGGMGDRQLNWLKEELESATKNDEEVIILCHYPLFPAGGAHNLWNDDTLKRLLAEYPSVIAYFNGHQHRGGYEYTDGIHFVNFKGMVEGQENAFAIVNLYPDRIEIIGYGNEESRSLHR